MAATTEPRSGIKYGWGLGFNGWHTEMDDNLKLLGRFGFHLSVKDKDLTTPPASPVSGDSYIVGAAATGAWAGKAGNVALWDGAAWVFGVPRNGWRAFVEDEDSQYRYKSGVWAITGGTGGTTTTAKATIQLACSDEVTALTTGAGKITFRMPYAMTLTEIRASLSTASSSGLVTVDIKESGVSLFSTALTIDATEKTSTTAAAPAVLSDTALADDAEITVDITGAGTGAKGLKITLLGTRAL